MRIIAGEFRGRKLLPPAGDATRPITDRAKQSLFDTLSPRLADALVYDCFAGTGSMGLECLSRGAQRATFFETDRSAVALLKQNINALAVDSRSELVTADIFKWGKTAAPAARLIDLIFLDPPYRFLKERAQELRDLVLILARDHLSPQGLIIFRHDRADALDFAGLQASDRRDYGNMRVEFLAAGVQL